LKKVFLVFTIVLAPLVSLVAQPSSVHSGNEDKALTGNLGDEPVLIWADEFDGTGIPDPARWDRPEYNRRPNAKGPDGYWSREDSCLDGKGNLVIRVRKIDDKNNDGDPFDNSVGAVRTAGKFSQVPQSARLPVSDLSSGLYLLMVQADGYSFNQRFIKN
jgi:hypothetical protein